MTHRTHRSLQQRGASLIEIMVGVVIGLIAILVIYQVFAVSEGLRRNTTGVGDAQQNGLLTSFALGIELANAGNGIATSAQRLYNCSNLSADPTKSYRPVPVLITDSGNKNTPDEFSVFYSASTSLVTPVPFASVPTTYASGADFVVQSPLPGALNAFKPGDMVIAIKDPRAPDVCARSIIKTVTGPAGEFVTLAHTLQDGAGVDFTSESLLFNLGQATRVQRVRYYVDPATSVLYSQNLLRPDLPPVPLASGVINLKAQFGIDTDNDGFLDDWVEASEAGWDAATLMAGAGTKIEQLSSIKAVRIGVVTRSEQFDPAATAFAHTLFNCAAPPCDGAIDITAPAQWRYRVYETIVPLRNVIWNQKL
ncbi:MAG: PilW family protein [Betaproteobacteria bacterium]|nr:PilW family protein [Betaproteobacteria bacterium]